MTISSSIFKVCFLLVALTSAEAREACANSPGGCKAGEDDPSTLIQTRVRIGHEALSPDRNHAIQPGRSKKDLGIRLGRHGMEVDHLGKVKACGGDEPIEHVEGKALGPIPLIQKPFEGAKDDPSLRPYLAQQEELEKVAMLESKHSNDQSDGWKEQMRENMKESGLLQTDKEDEDLEEEEDDEKMSQQKEMESMTKQIKDALKNQKDAVKKHQRRQSNKKDRHITAHAPVALETSSHGKSNQAAIPEYRLVARNQYCKAQIDYVDKFDTVAQCAQAVLDKGKQFFIYGKDHAGRQCKIVKTKMLRCEEGFQVDANWDSYHVYKRDMASIWDVFPKEGSIFGGTMVTIQGANLYTAHSTMGGSGGSSSDLQGSVQIKFFHASSGHIIDCPLETFGSREDSIKCITPGLGDFANLTDAQMEVIVYTKNSSGAFNAAERPGHEDLTQFVFSTGATPQLERVEPVAVGAGQILKLQGWSCSGIVEAEPVLIVPAGSAPVADAGEGSSTVDDPQDAWGHQCLPWPPVEDRQRLLGNSMTSEEHTPTQEERELMGAPGQLGAAGLDTAVYFLESGDVVPDDHLKLKDFLSTHSITEPHRLIMKQPYLPWNTHYAGNKESPYVAQLEGWLQIATEGNYKFRLNAMDSGYIMIDGSNTLTDTRRRKKKTAGWGHWELWSGDVDLYAGWHKITVVHAAVMHDRTHSGLEVRYKGADTSDNWQIPSFTRLRAGITEEDAQRMNSNQEHAEAERYLVPAKEILTDKVSMGPGISTCPDGSVQKYVEFMCQVSSDMLPGFYDIQYYDHRYGQSEIGGGQWETGMGGQKATLKIVPVIDKVEVYSATGQMAIHGSGLDGIDNTTNITYNGKVYSVKTHTQDHIELADTHEPSTDGSLVFGARGLLREFWFTDRWPEESDAMMDPPAWKRASNLITPIEQTDTIGQSGFSERLSGLFTPPYSGECRWIMQGTQTHGHYTANEGAIYIDPNPHSGLQDQAEAPPAPQVRQYPLFAYPGAILSDDGREINKLVSEDVLGGAFSVAFKLTQDDYIEWNRFFDFGNGHKDNIMCYQHWKHAHLRCSVKKGQHDQKNIEASNVLNKDGKAIDVLWTVTEKGYSEIWVNGAYQTSKDDMNVPEHGVARPQRYIGKATCCPDKHKMKGSINKFQWYNKVVTWYDAYGPPKKSQLLGTVSAKLVKPDMMCSHTHNDYLGKYDSVGECAQAVKDKDHKYFIYGKQHKKKECHAQKVSGAKCAEFHFDWNRDFYRIVEHNPKPPTAISFPAEPAVRTDAGHKKASPYMSFEEGKSYPFKMERRVGGRSETTGVDGWAKLGLECRTLASQDAVTNAQVMGYLPRQEYSVTMEMKKYSAQLVLPKKKGGQYTLAYSDRSAVVTSDKEAGPALKGLFGATCSSTALDSDTSDGANFKIFDYEGGQFKDHSYCGTGSKSPVQSKDGTHVGETVLAKESETGTYNLEDFPFLHMCYKIAPGARVNMVVKCKVGGGGHHDQDFSIGMTDNRFSEFDDKLKIAAQWPIELDHNGETTDDWTCTSINLLGQIMDWEHDGYRRFSHIDYHREENGKSSTHDRRPSNQLRQMKIREIKLAAAVGTLAGNVVIDQLVASKSMYDVTQTAAALVPAGGWPFKSSKGWQTSAGWKVEWFGGYKDWVGKYNEPLTEEPHKITFEKELDFKDCRVGFTQADNKHCNHYGWRATAIINFDEAGEWKFKYSIDDDMYIYTESLADGQITESDRLKCCTGYKSGTTTSKTKTTKGFDLAAGEHKVEVHMWQGGGGNYGKVMWYKVGKEDTKYMVAEGGAGITMDHPIDFVPKERSKLPELATFLQGVTLDGNAMTANFPLGTVPPSLVTVSEPPSEVAASWATQVSISKNYNWKEDVNVGAQAFNQAFAACPVVAYVRDDEIHSIYVRTTPVESTFNAFELFTEHWSSDSAHNTFGTDFEIYSSLSDVTAGTKWKYCDSGSKGYPGFCHEEKRHHDNYAFKMPSYGGPKGVLKAGFDIFDGPECPSQAVSSPSTGPTATFDMSMSDQEIGEAIKAAGLPDVEVSVAGRGGIEYLDLRNAHTYQSSEQHNGASSRAVDGQGSKQNWHDNSCTHTQKDSQPWWIVKLPGKVEIDHVEVTSRDHHVGGQLNHFALSVDGVPCAEDVEITDGEVKKVACRATGSSVMIHLPRKEHLVICEVKVGVAVAVDPDSMDDAPETDSFTMTVTNKQGGRQPILEFSSDLAASVSSTMVSNGARFWDDVTDFWFRMPHNNPQVQLGPWRDYVTERYVGTNPITKSGSFDSNGTLSLFQMSHGVRGNVHHSVRRNPPRKWRLPPRYHTHETLEALSRRVLGTSESPRGWAATSVLLQMHADSDKHQEFKAGRLDPRDDPNPLRWTDPASWGGEDPPTGASTDIIYFPEGKTGMLDMNVNIRFWVIEGNLVWDLAKDISMGAEAVVVNGGQFLIGKESGPYTGKGLITLDGHWHSMKLPLCGAKTIFQTMGNIEMHGIKIKQTWTDLSTTAYPGDQTIHLREPVDWVPGSMLVVAASDKVVRDCRLDRRDDCEVEERYVKTILNDGLSIELDRPLVYRHLAEELDTVFTTAQLKRCETMPALCEKTQVRAEVGLLSRNLVVKGSNYEDGSGPAGSEGYGAHLMHAVKAQYTYVEFHWMGQAFQMGRYPLHLHLTGLNPTSKILGCSLHRTFQRGITLHGTHSALIEDVVLYNHLSHGYFIEDGNEHNNVFEHNLGMMAHPSYSMLVSDQTPATFWIRNPSNHFRNNHAAGSHSFGFWYDTFGPAMWLEARDFINNTAHSNGNTGLWMDNFDPHKDCQAPDTWTIGIPFKDSDAVSKPVMVNPPSCEGTVRMNAEFISTTTWGNEVHGVMLFENGHIHMINHRDVSSGNHIIAWGLVSDNWADVTNEYYGPAILHSVYHAQSGLTEAGFKVECGIGGPWDDTLYVEDVNFHGTLERGGFCPCFECIAEEGGYEIRTKALSWHDGAGKVGYDDNFQMHNSPKVNWPWLMASFFFDFDGTLTDADSQSCVMNGCYLHSHFHGRKAGMYMRKADAPATTSTPAPTIAPTTIAPTEAPTTTVLPTDAPTTVAPAPGSQPPAPGSQPPAGPGGWDEPPAPGPGGLSLAELEELDEVDSDSMFYKQSQDAVRNLHLHPKYVAASLSEVGAKERRCLRSMVGRYENEILPNANITASSYAGDNKHHGKGEMWRSRIDGTHNAWCAGKNDRDQWIQWDFGVPTWITAIQTQGRSNHDQWVTSYKLECDPDGSEHFELVANHTIFDGNRDRSTVQEHRIIPIKCQKLRLLPYNHHKHICMRADVLGCAGTEDLKELCVDKAFLDPGMRNCRKVEEDEMSMSAWCKDKGHKAMYTALSANQACCSCGGGENFYTQEEAAAQNSSQELPEAAPVKIIKGGTAYMDPDQCYEVDNTGGIVCERSVRMQSVTIKNAGVWHFKFTIDVQSEFGFSEIIFIGCYKQYEFTVFQDMRHMLVPPYTPKEMFDWDFFDATVKLRAGDRYVLQFETIHNPDGFTVAMPGQTKNHFCSTAPVQYNSDFFDNQTLLNELKLDRDMHSANSLDLALSFDMYKQAHIPLLERAGSPNTAADWGYIQANESYVAHEWYPGSFQFLVSTDGLVHSSNHFGPWNGRQNDIMEQMPTRPINKHEEAARKQFSHIETTLKWNRWDQAAPSPAPGMEQPPLDTMTRLEYLVKYCGFTAASFGHMGQEAVAAVANHSAVTEGRIQAGQLRKFKWSEWPADLGGKPVFGKAEDGFGNVSIEQNWEVTLDEDVDFINKLNISGVLKFEDKPGCCKIVARYIFVGPTFGRLEAGTSANPITQGTAHIVLKGHPMTPNLKMFRPHLVGSAKFLRNKFIAVQGTLSLYGAARSRTWVRVAETSAAGTTSLKLESTHDFKAGDTVTIHRGIETRKIASVDGDTITFTEPLNFAYKGLNHVYYGRDETTGKMATAVGLVDGHHVVVEGEDTPGVPMCDKSANQTCPYQGGFPEGMNLHDFAKEMRHYLEKTGAANHPNCRPCLAVSEMDHPGYIVAMAHFHYKHRWCPKDHGEIQASGVVFKHASSMNFYYRYNGDNAFPDGVPYSVSNAWNNKGRINLWRSDPVWDELDVANPPRRSHLVRHSAFNNTRCGSAFAAATSGLYEATMDTISDNVMLRGGVGLNSAARSGGVKGIGKWIRDKMGPVNDNFATLTQGVGSNNDEGTSEAWFKNGYGTNIQKLPFEFMDNFMSGATLHVDDHAIARNNMLLGPVSLIGGPVSNPSDSKFTGNTIHNRDDAGCVRMWVNNNPTSGISDNVVYGCLGSALVFGQVTVSQGMVARMTLLDSPVGIYYYTTGPDSKKHSAKRIEFNVADSVIYAKEDGSGTGLRNPIVQAHTQGEPIAPDWWHIGGKNFPLGHSAPTLYFRTKVTGTTWVGYKRQTGGVAVSVGGGHMSDSGDSDYHPIFFSGVHFENMEDNAKFWFANSIGAGSSIRQCIQIDCDGRRNALMVDEDGTLLGEPGTVIPVTHKMYDPLHYMDPLGFESMEDLIPFPARYDRFGDAIPFPSGVDHGTGGGLEYRCDNEAGCAPVKQSLGHWVPNTALTLPKDTRIVAIREDGGIIRLDPLHHGWAYATYWVYTSDCVKTMDPEDSPKPESQHARRYGRIAAGVFGEHPNASKVWATRGPVYTKPGIYREGCEHVAEWNAYKCAGGKHRHLLIEVMDWNHMDRRWAPVSVEVNDAYAPQGGYLNVMSGPAMYWTSPMQRLQSFHALAHAGMRHNIYFSADPPQHLRLHYQYADSEDGLIACVYYGLPNNIVAYADGQKKEAPAEMIPTWDNLVFTPLTVDMPHGTFYYDRVGVETGRPGYLYAVLRGSKHVDFKISHKIILSTKIKVDGDWGGWNDPDSNNFYKKGIDGLVRNIALLIGCPPTRVAILGNGTARKGTFWNEQTTSEDFAKWIWEQNKSMDKMTMEEWLQAPGADLAEESLQPELLLEHDHRKLSFLSQFAEHRHSLLAAALERHGPAGKRWHHNMVFLTKEEQSAVLAHRQIDDQTEAGEKQLQALNNLMSAKAEQAMRDGFAAEAAKDGYFYVDAQSDADQVAPSIGTDGGPVDDQVAMDTHAYNQEQLVAEQEGYQTVGVCQKNAGGAGGCQLPIVDDASDPALLALGKRVKRNSTEDQSVLKITTDKVDSKNNPLGWNCETSQYGDGFCDCGCGIWDPDCEPSSFSVGAIYNGTEELAILDDQHLTAIMRFLDQDSNGNGIIDGSEIIKIQELGVSALHGAATRVFKAQENGQGGGSYWKGDFAHLQAEMSTSCAYLADPDIVHFPAGSAEYIPVCVKDKVWNTLFGMPTGRCGLLPQMKIGSQCVVPGDGSMYDLGPDGTPRSVCEKISEIFPAGGTGGIFSAGMGVTTAEFFNTGAYFVPGIGDTQISKEQLEFTSETVGDLDATFSAGMSVFLRLKPEGWTKDPRIFSFGPQGRHNPHDRIEVALDGAHTDSKHTLSFYVANTNNGKHYRQHHMKIDNAVTRGQEDAFLFTYKPKGELQVIRNGHLLKSEEVKTIHGLKLTGAKMEKLVFAMPCHGQHSDGFYGDITDIRVWSREVTWDAAISGTIPNDEPHEDANEAQGDLAMQCIPSKKNSWDFVCGDEVPPELREKYGYGSLSAETAKAEFEKRKVMGQVAECSDKISAKAVIYEGTFGDGLTVEYYQMQTACHQPPFIFGKMPKRVGVDPLVKYTGAEFLAPKNQLAIRWTGKLLIAEAGTYEFKISADDGAWLALDGNLVVDLSGCGHHRKTKRDKTETIELDKGSHDISVLYFNEGPGDKMGEFEIQYKGPDSEDVLMPIPTEKLGSAPLRLAKLAQELDKDSTQTVSATMPGAFVYDEQNRVGVMNGNCDFECQKGLRKSAGAFFKFFCNEAATGSLTAKVNAAAKFALTWMDQQSSELWTVGTGTIDLNQVASKLSTNSSHREILHHALSIKNDDPGPMITSAPSKVYTLDAGEHTFVLQGRPDEHEVFAIGELKLTGELAEQCFFFLEGSDKTSQNCME
jgi:hypothetical protein